MSDDSSLLPLWTWPELSNGLTSRQQAGPDVTGVCVDSRILHPGDLFVALHGDPGPRFNPGYRSTVDGHDYIAAAAAASAAGALVRKDALVRKELPDLPADFPLIPVADTYDALWDLGRLARARLGGEVVAITGSSGKTTAKNFLRAALNGYAPPGSFNNHIGVPLSLANAPAGVETAIFEIGTNHPGEIAPLAEMVAATAAVLLNVHLAHIENFDNREELVKEKLNIFNTLRDKSKAISEDILQLQYGATFGTTRQAQARVVSLQGDLATVDLFGVQHEARVPGGGLHRAITVAATLLTCHLLGRDLVAACNLPEETVPLGRGNQRRIGAITLIDDSYNANPDSMHAALQSFSALPGTGRRIAVIGEMLELGNASVEAHMGLVPSLQTIDAVFCVGTGTRDLAEKLGAVWHAQAGVDLCAAILADVTPDTAILVKGSNRVFWANNFVEVLAREIELL